MHDAARSTSHDAARPPAHAWLSIVEAAAEMRVGPRTLYKAIRRGELRAARVNGRDMRVNREWLAEWATRQTHTAA